jgi:hypothetical protein
VICIDASPLLHPGGGNCKHQNEFDSERCFHDRDQLNQNARQGGWCDCCMCQLPNPSILIEAAHFMPHGLKTLTVKKEFLKIRMVVCHSPSSFILCKVKISHCFTLNKNSPMSVLDVNYFLGSESCCIGVYLTVRTNIYNGRTRLDRITCASFL